MRKFLMILLYILPVPVIFISLFIGPSADAGISALLSYFKSSHSVSASEFEMMKTILLQVRLPRILLAFLIGASLSASGQTMQALFRNPLVEPYILGISSGGAFGAAVAIATGIASVQVCAYIGGLSAAAISYLIAKSGKQLSIITLLLSGIIVSGIFTALLAVVQFISNPFRLQTIVHWTIGNLHNASFEKISSAIIPMTVGIAWILAFRWRINVVSLGDDEAHAAGIDPARERLLVLLPATLIATSSVAVAGIIPMVGLIIPHITRMVFGADNSKSLPACIILGGIFVVIVDDASRALMSFELPIGIFTMAVGGPLFFYLMKKMRVGMAV